MRDAARCAARERGLSAIYPAAMRAASQRNLGKRPGLQRGRRRLRWHDGLGEWSLIEV